MEGSQPDPSPKGPSGSGMQRPLCTPPVVIRLKAQLGCSNFNRLYCVSSGGGNGAPRSGGAAQA